MTPLSLALLVIGALVILWIAYKIGKIVLRLALGLAILALAGYLIWKFLS